MIELIFVIIILGVLASIAVPRLAATRDDAKISVMSQQIESGLSEILANYTSQGIVKKPHEMSQILNKLINTGHAAVTTNAQIPGSVGQLTVYTQNGTGGNDASFVFDINQTTLVFKHGSPCVGSICRTLQSRVSEGNYSIGGSHVVF